LKYFMGHLMRTHISKSRCGPPAQKLSDGWGTRRKDLGLDLGFGWSGSYRWQKPLQKNYESPTPSGIACLHEATMDCAWRWRCVCCLNVMACSSRMGPYHWTAADTTSRNFCRQVIARFGRGLHGTGYWRRPSLGDIPYGGRLRSEHSVLQRCCLLAVDPIPVSASC